MPRSRSKGQALTEFILVIPLFLILLLGVVQLSLLSFAQQMVHYAAFAATRAAIVRPCMAFHPDNDNVAHFTPAVFSAAVLSTMVAAPPHQLNFSSFPYDWMPVLPETPEVEGLDFRSGSGQFADYKYMNAVHLTSVQRVEPNLNDEPVTWDPNPRGPGIGMPCVFPWDPLTELIPQQNVPPTGRDLSLEVVFLFPMQIPFVNRIFYGIFVNFSSFAQNELNLLTILGGGTRPEAQVMKLPIHDLPDISRYESSVTQMVNRVTQYFNFHTEGRFAGIDIEMKERQWYPLPLRARCTLTVEGSIDPLVTFPFP